MGWCTLPYSTGTAEEQLQQSELLWRRVAAGQAPATRRWYGYLRPAVILGVGQPASTIDEVKRQAAGVEVVKRTSGGAAVLADETVLALDIALPLPHPLAGRDIVEAYRWVGELLALTLRRLAPAWREHIVVVNTTQARADQAGGRTAPAHSAAALRAMACFGTLSPYEVALSCPGPGGEQLRKLVGLSQVRKRGVALYQAALYSRFSGRQLANLLALPSMASGHLAEELDRRVADLTDLGRSAGDVPRLMALFNDASMKVEH